MKNRPVVTLALALALLAARADALPDFFQKPTTWRSLLVTNDNKTVSDEDFAKLVARTQTNIRNTVKMVNGQPVSHNAFTFLGSFTQCFGGGFITELQRQGVTNYGGNSASTYFEPASYDLVNQRSFYPFAWTTMADYLGAAAPTDEWITWKAYDALDPTKPLMRAITKNRDYAIERAQYRSDRAGVPQALGAAQHNYAVIWVGKPHPKKADYNDVNKLYELLISAKYKLNPADIQILWADKVDPDATDKWKPTGKAEWADLQAAFQAIEGTIKGLPYGDSYQVFFFSGDHGNADYSITITVDPAAQGLPFTGVNAYRGTGQNIFLAGAGTNEYLLTEQTAGQPLKALSFGDDFQNPDTLFKSSAASPTAIIYFSVDNASVGLADTELNLARAGGELQGPNIYAQAASGNRLIFHGQRNLGLVTGAGSDELNDFVLRDMTRMLDPVSGLPTRPVFFTNAQDSRIWVHDPAPPLVPGRPKTYVYYDFNTDYKLPQGPPKLVDALAMVVNLRRRDPVTDQLVFDKKNDYMLFSVGRNEVAAPWRAYKPCDIIRFGGNANEMLWASCNFLGLDPMKDNVDGLDIGAGRYGQPISFDQEAPWPQYEYPNWADDPPLPNEPLPPYPPS